MDAVTAKRGRAEAPAKGKALDGLRSAFVRSGRRRFSGFVFDSQDLARKFTIDILLDGYPILTLRAEQHVIELTAQAIGDGCYGFSCSLDEAAIDDGTVIEARLSNLGGSVGKPIAFGNGPKEKFDTTDGRVKWLGGLRFSAVAESHNESALLYVDGALVTRIRPSAWTHLGSSKDDARAARAFDIHLPDRFADGHVHALTIATEIATEKSIDDPVYFIAFSDRLHKAITDPAISAQDQLRAELLDRLLPMSIPFVNYGLWRQKSEPCAQPSAALKASVIIIGHEFADVTAQSLENQVHTDWIAALIPQTTSPVSFDARLVRTFLDGEGANCDFVVFVMSGTALAHDALQRISHTFGRFTDAQSVYSDLDVRSIDGTVWPLALSAFDYERMLEQGYCNYLFALKRLAAFQSLEAGASNLYRVFNSVLDTRSLQDASIIHIPRAIGTLPQFDRTAAGQALALAASEHMRRRGIAATVLPQPATGMLPAVHVKRKCKNARTTIVIPTRNRKQLLQACIESILPAVTKACADILVIDNDSAESDTLGYFDEIDGEVATIVRVPGPFNFARLNNHAAKHSRSEMLCLLNNDVTALDDGWLEEMLGRITTNEVGAVGALLVWPSGIVQHGGVVLGPGFAATHAFNDRMDGDAGYGDMLCVARECSAVTAACLVTRRSDYLAVGGMDELRFPVNFNDVDYCLRLRALGKRIVFTPHAKLAHLESATRGHPVKKSDSARLERELQNLRARWGDVLSNDPYYSPILSLDPVPFSALAWPVRALDARANTAPVATEAPVGY